MVEMGGVIQGTHAVDIVTPFTKTVQGLNECTGCLHELELEIKNLPVGYTARPGLKPSTVFLAPLLTSSWPTETSTHQAS